MDPVLENRGVLARDLINVLAGVDSDTIRVSGVEKRQ